MVSGTSSLKALREEECLISSVPWKTNAERDLWYLKAIRTYVPASSGYFMGNKKCRFSNDADVSTETGSAVTIWSALVRQPGMCTVLTLVWDKSCSNVPGLQGWDSTTVWAKGSVPAVFLDGAQSPRLEERAWECCRAAVHPACLPATRLPCRQLWAAHVCQCPAACAQGQSPQAGGLVTNPQCLSLVDGTVPHHYVWSLVLQPPRSVAKIPSPPALQIPGLNAPQSSPAGFSTCVLSLREPCTTDDWFQGSTRVLCPWISMPICQAVIRAEARYHKMWFTPCFKSMQAGKKEQNVVTWKMKASSLAPCCSSRMLWSQ